MAQPSFRVVEKDRQHPRDIARQAVKQFRTEGKWGVCNQSASAGAKRLSVDEIIASTEREMPEEIRTSYRVNPIVVFWIIVGVLLSAVLVVQKFI